MILLLESLSKQPDIIVLTESFLDSNNMTTTKLDGYNDFHVVRGEDKRGGVSIFVRNHLDADNIEEFSYIDSEIEICTVSLKMKTTTYTISGIYRPRFKHHKVKEFTKKLSSILQHETFKKNKTLLIGDFNINLLEHNEHRETGEYLNKM